MKFRDFVIQNFPFLEDDFDALTDYQLFCKMVGYMKKALEKVDKFSVELDEFEHYFDNLDVQEEINNKLDEMLEDGSLTEIVSQIFATLQQEIDDTNSAISTTTETLRGEISSTANTLRGEITAGDDSVKNFLLNSINAQGEEIQTNANNITTLSGRVDNLAHLSSGSTTGDAELIDGRTGYNGVTYNSIGDAIRSQVSDIHKALDLYHVDLIDAKNGSNGNLGNTNAISFATVQPTNNTSVKVRFHIPSTALTDVETLRVTLSTYKVDNGLTTASSDKLEEIVDAFIINPYESFIIDKDKYFTRRLDLTQPIGFACSIQAYDDEENIIPLRIANTGTNIITIEETPFDGYYSYRVASEDANGVYPLMRDGSCGNTANVNAVATANIIPIKNKAVRITYVKDIPTAKTYEFTIFTYSINSGAVIDANNPYRLAQEVITSKNNYIDYKLDKNASARGYAVSIQVYDANNDLIAQRIADGGYLKSIAYSGVIESIMDLGSENIINRNKDVLLNVMACTSSGINGGGNSNIKHKFSLLFTTDIHHSVSNFSNAIEYLNGIDYIDAGVCMGDMQASNYSENDGTWYTSLVNDSDKPFYTILGNHDLGNGTSTSTNATVAQAFTKFIYPTLDKIGNTSLTTPYYRVDNDTYKISMIYLNNYDVPNNVSGDDYVVSRGTEMISITQINWLLSQLDDIPSDYTLMVVMHSFPYPNEVIESNFTQPNITELTGNTVACYSDVIPDIINAWINKTTISKTYQPQIQSDAISAISVIHSFASRSESLFGCYFVGHIHGDAIARSTTYTNQKIVCLCATACDNWQNYNSDLPRIENTKAFDAITVATIDTDNHTIKLARVGSNKTINMVDRSYTKIDY